MNVTGLPHSHSFTTFLDFSWEFSHSSRLHGFCRHQRVIPHHVFLHGGKGVSNFRRLSHRFMSTKRCNERCCEEDDCSLAFIMQGKCYGVLCPDGGDCNSKEHMRVPLHLEIALVQRKGWCEIDQYNYFSSFNLITTRV